MPGKPQINWDKRSSFDVPDPVLLSVLSCPFYVVTPECVIRALSCIGQGTHDENTKAEALCRAQSLSRPTTEEPTACWLGH
jgi:hypothetical protein